MRFDYKGEDAELSALGLDRLTVCQPTSQTLDFDERCKFFQDDIKKSISLITYRKDDDTSSFAIFLNSNGLGGIDSKRIIEDPNLLELFYAAMTVHVMAHFYSAANTAAALIDILIIEAVLGFEHATIILDRVIIRISNELECLLSTNRINDRWNSVSVNLFTKQQEVFYFTVNSVDITKAHILNLAMTLDDIFPDNRWLSIISTIKSSIELKPNHLGWLKQVEDLIHLDYNSAFSYGYAKQDCLKVLQLLSSNDNMSRYSQCVTKSHFKEWIESVCNVHYNNLSFTTSTDFIFDYFVELIDSPHFEQALVTDSL
jgi:hypothetical protein